MSIAIPSLRGAIAVPGWAKNELWRRAKAVPSLDLRFAENRSLVDATTGAQLVTFSRTSEKTVRGPTAPIVVASGLPAFENDPVTGESLGLLIEEQRVQILELTDTLATQTKTVAATAHTLSFYGTGTVVLSGAHSATVAGLGTYPTRTTLTFTPSAGSLTLTVSGSVRFAQLEAGASATSYIPNSGTSQVTRAADVCSISGSNFSSWYRQDEGTMFADGNLIVAGTNNFPRIVSLAGPNSGTDEISLYTRRGIGVDDGRIFAAVTVSSSTQADIQPPVGSGVGLYKSALAYRSNDFALSNNGLGPNVDTSGTLPTATQLIIMGIARFQPMSNGHIRRLTYWPQRLPNAVLQTITL